MIQKFPPNVCLAVLALYLLYMLSYLVNNTRLSSGLHCPLPRLHWSLFLDFVFHPLTVHGLRQSFLF